MNFLLENWYVVLIALVSGGLLLWPVLRDASGGGESVDVAEAVRLINREKAVLIDVGDEAEYAAGHVAGARHAPLAQLAGHAALPGDKARPIVLVCAKGNRSPRAAALLRKAGHTQVKTLAGGAAAWRNANLPLEKSA